MSHDLDQRICNLEGILIEQAYEHLQEPETVDTHEMGEVMDMIKDIAEIERNHYEACYYKSVVEAMENRSTDTDVQSMVKSIKHIWTEANFDRKQEIKNSITSLMSEMV